MRTEEIEQRLQDITNEIFFLDSLKDAHDDTNIHELEQKIDVLVHEKRDLTYLLMLYFDQMIGL